ncbi:MAG: DUF6166 domain-containing protein [Bacteroidota bacterium]
MYTINLPHSYAFRAAELPPVLVEDSGLVVREQGGGYRLPEPDAYARRIAVAAEHWLDHARERSRMKDETLVRKALDAVAFTLRHRAHDLCVPTKLSGTSRYQRALWRLVRQRVGFGTPLTVEEEDGLLVVSHHGERLGEVQRKHVGWLSPLLHEAFGARLYLTRVTGSEKGFTLGCNLGLTGVGGALERFNRAHRPDDGDVDCGPHPPSYALVEGALAEGVEKVLAQSSAVDGDGATERPLVTVPDGGDDIRLWRDSGGTAHACVEHVVVYSPTGLEWGYVGGGPGDLAVSILAQVAGAEAAAQHAHAFVHDVVARIPHEGGVVRAAAVWAWLLARTTDLSA